MNATKWSPPPRLTPSVNRTVIIKDQTNGTKIVMKTIT